MTAADVVGGGRPWSVEQGDCVEWLRGLPAGCVHCCVTSPPYFALRSYLPKGHPLKAKEVGAEPTPEAFVATMVGVFREVRRVLHDSGVLFLNLGDSYAGGGKSGGGRQGDDWDERGADVTGVRGGRWSAPPRGLKVGDLCGIPWAVAFALRDDGWTLRSDIVWGRTAPMPESVSVWRWERCRVKVGGGWTKETHPAVIGVNGGRGEGRVSGGVATGKNVGVAEWQDCPGCRKCEASGGLVLRRGSWRPTKSHEHVFLLAKGPDYFADGEAVRTPLASATVSRDQYSRITETADDEQYAVRHDHETQGNASGANLRDVWMLGPQPQADVRHYALMAPEVARRCVLAGTSDGGVCPACGWPWARVLNRRVSVKRPSERGLIMRAQGLGTTSGAELEPATSETLGWRPTCACPEHDAVPPLVMDPFAGSGTTLLAARRLGRRAVGVDLNEEYASMARRRLSADMPLFG